MTPSPKIQRHILNCLHLEWETARNAQADPAVRALTPPTFAFHGARTVLGKWSPGKREISLALHLLTEYGWDTLREILFHEMAHQIAHEVFGATHETPHGPAFHKACDLLGANPEASGSFATLRERIENEEEPSEDALTARIRKLFALSESSNPHESQAALSKARQLMEKHQIQSLEAVKSPRNYTSIFLGKPKLKHHREFYALANFLTEHCFVRGIWAMACVVERGKMGRVLEISGTPAQVLSAEYTWAFILRAIDRAWEAHCIKENHNPGRYAKSDFAEGLIEGFSEKLREEKASETKTPENRLPDIVRDPLLDTYLKRRYPRIVTRTRQGRNVRPDLIKKGRTEGKKLSLNPGLEKKKTKKPKAISHRKK